MRKKILLIVSLLIMSIFLNACSMFNKQSEFKIHFIDVGQGDAALIVCDNHYMLIDGGGGKTDAENITIGNKVYDVLKKYKVKKLDILAISHLHADHIGGLSVALQALKGKKNIGITLCNSNESDTKVFRDFETELIRNKSKITIPEQNSVYKLGSATVKVLDVQAKDDNDSLVLLITYHDTQFLFTGDIGRKGQQRVADVFQAEQNSKQRLIKMPHHGAYETDYGMYDNALYRLLREYNPSHFIISVGKGNQYNHPHDNTLDMIEQLVVNVKGLDWETHVGRTDEKGDIIVKSDGKKIEFLD